MSDPKKDWLEEELRSLRDLEAPGTLAPSVMKRIHDRAGRPWWVRLAESHSDLIRSLVLGISLVMLVLLLLVNPAQYLAGVPGASALWNIVPLLLEAAKSALFQAKIFNFSLLGILGPVIILSYVLLIASASAIRHLVSAPK
jgi:hypothetical protein